MKEKTDTFFIVAITSNRDRVIQFTNSMIKTCTISSINTGDVTPFYFGVGYILPKNVNEFLSRHRTRSFRIWVSMIYRCYSGTCRNYKNVSVCNEWHNYINFALWYEKNQVDGWDIDKDLFSKGGVKIYSPQTCCFIPNIINSSIRAKINIKRTIGGAYYFYDTSCDSENRRIYAETEHEAFKMCVLYRQTHLRTLVSAYWKSIDIKTRNKLIHLYDNEEGQIFKNKRITERKRVESERFSQILKG